MKKLYLNTGSFKAVFNNLKDSFNGKLLTNEYGYNLNVKSKWTKGSITGTSFDDKVLFMNFDLVFNEDVSLSIESFQGAPVFFVYCEDGNFTHAFGVNAEKKQLKKNQSAILSNSSVINSVLYFESHKRIKFTVFGIPTAVSVEGQHATLIENIKKRFITDSGNFFFVGKENHKIADKIQEFNTVPQKGIVANLVKKSILKDIIELEIAQHSYNYLQTFDPIVNLATKQMHELKKLSKMNISEIISNAGMASRHYFPRLLKEKYHLSFKPYNQKLAS